MVNQILILVLFTLFCPFMFGQNCIDKVTAVCQNTNRQLSLSHSADGTILINPRVDPSQILTDSRLRDSISASPNGMNTNNFNNRIVPMFNDIKAILNQRVLNIPMTNPMRQHLIERIRTLSLRAVDWESGRGGMRCQRESNPFAASIDNRANTIQICPWMTHLDYRSLISIVAHELGHLSDPCHNLESSPTMNGVPFREAQVCLRQRAFSTSPHLVAPLQQPNLPLNGKLHCSFQGEEDENFADMAGAQLTADYLNTRSQIFNGLDETQKVGSLLAFRLIGENCSTQTNQMPLFYLQNAAFQTQMGCSSLNSELNSCSQNSLLPEENEHDTQTTSQ